MTIRLHLRRKKDDVDCHKSLSSLKRGRKNFGKKDNTRKIFRTEGEKRVLRRKEEAPAWNGSTSSEGKGFSF